MSDVEIREECVVADFNRKRGVSCTDEKLCAECWMEQDVAQHSRLYEALADE